MTTFAPVKVSALCEVEERYPVCGLSREKAIEHALAAYGDDAGIVIDDDYGNDIVWIAGDEIREEDAREESFQNSQFGAGA